MKKKTLIILSLSAPATLVAVGILFAETMMGHIPISHDHSTSICWGYAQGRAFGKSEGDAECDPVRTYADKINESYFPFISDPSLEGIKPGDIVVFGQIRQGLQGHAAYVIEVPTTGTIWDIRVDQVPYQGAAPQHNLTLQQVKDQGQGNPVGYHKGSGGNAVTLTFKNSFNSGSIYVGKNKFGQWIERPSGWSGLFFFGSVLEIMAIDPQYDNSGNQQGFRSWQKDGQPDGDQNPRAITISGSATITANFDIQYNVTFQNNLPGTSGGQIKVNGSTYTAPHTTRVFQSNPNVTSEGLYQTISSIEYSFISWADGVTTNPRTFTATGDVTYTANFAAKPLPPTNVQAGAPIGQNVKVTWTDNPNPDVTQYRIYRRTKDRPWEWVASKARGIQSWTDTGFKVTGTGSDAFLQYQLYAYYSVNGALSDPAGAVTYATRTGIEARVSDNGRPTPKTLTGNLPNEYAVANFPNPFNPATTISYQLVEDAEVVLEIFDLMGRKLATMLNERKSAGYHTVQWVGRDQHGNITPSGVYLYRFTAIPANGKEPFRHFGKLLLTK